MPKMTVCVAFLSEVSKLLIHGLQELIDVQQVPLRFWPRSFLHWASGEMTSYFQKEKVSVWISWIERSWERNRYYSKHSPTATGKRDYLLAHGVGKNAYA
jgi:hypothetical protein